MRKDIAETLRVFLMNGIKPNYSKIAKQFNCDARTVKRYFLNCQNLNVGYHEVDPRLSKQMISN